LSGAAQNTKTKLKADQAMQRKFRIIFPPSQQRDMRLVWIGAAKSMAVVRATMQLGK
jgi:hypothetical protein